MSWRGTPGPLGSQWAPPPGVCQREPQSPGHSERLPAWKLTRRHLPDRCMFRRQTSLCLRRSGRPGALQGAGERGGGGAGSQLGLGWVGRATGQPSPACPELKRFVCLQGQGIFTERKEQLLAAQADGVITGSCELSECLVRRTHACRSTGSWSLGKVPASLLRSKATYCVWLFPPLFSFLNFY